MSLFVALIAPAAAWGNAGHQAVGEIAWQELEHYADGRAVRDALKAILAGDGPEGDDGAGNYRRLYSAATWADNFAKTHDKDWGWLAPMHYVSLKQDTAGYVRTDATCPKAKEGKPEYGPAQPDRCAVEAIPYYAARLADRELNDAQRVLALRLVAHFVGDLHQPLHTSHVDGRGGNSTVVTFEGESMRMHAVWDDGVIESNLKRRADGWEEFKRGDGWQSWAVELADKVTDDQRKAWTADMTSAGWANESLALSKGELFKYKAGSKLPADYVDKALPTIEQRVSMAGVRLAALLEQSLKGE